MLERIYIWLLRKRYGVQIRKVNGQYRCISVGQQISAWTLPELKAKIERMV